MVCQPKTRDATRTIDRYHSALDPDHHIRRHQINIWRHQSRHRAPVAPGDVRNLQPRRLALALTSVESGAALGAIREETCRASVGRLERTARWSSSRARARRNRTRAQGAQLETGGGGGNRTRVRMVPGRRVYVRSPCPISVGPVAGSWRSAHLDRRGSRPRMRPVSGRGHSLLMTTATR